jgi:RNA polymerase sigma-70 factor (ECF subfamily)
MHEVRHAVQSLSMLGGDESDEEVIDRIARGDREAVRTLYHRYGRLVYGLALQVVGESSAAEEVAQDVFMRAWEKAGNYRVEKAKVSTWLMRITRNRAIDVVRQRGPAGSRTTSAWDDLASAADPAAPDLAERAARTECDEDLRTALAALPDEQRRALDLAFFKGLTHQGIAEALREPLGTVKTRIRDAMRKLRGSIAEECAP